MLKKFYCKQCEQLRVVDQDEGAEIGLCDTYDQFDEGPGDGSCGGELIEFKDNLFPVQTEVIAIIADLSSKLTVANLEAENRINMNSALEATLKQTTQLVNELVKSEGDAKLELSKVYEERAQLVVDNQELKNKLVALRAQKPDSDAVEIKTAN